MTSSLDLIAAVRPAGAVDRGGQRTDRHFMEFVVDGQRLGRMLGPFLGCADVTQDHVPVLVTDWPNGIALADLAPLLGAAPAAELDGRTALYVCAECGDLGCGAVTAVVQFDGRQVVWSEFGYQNNYEPFDATAVFGGMGPFVFDRAEYSATLERFWSSVTTAPPPAST